MATNKITQEKVGNKEVLRFKSKQNIQGDFGFDDSGFTFDKQISQSNILVKDETDCSPLDLKDGNIFKISLGGNIASFSCVNAEVTTYTFIFTQDATGGRSVTFDSNFYFETSAPDFSSDAAGTINIVTALYDGSKFYIATMSNLINA